MGEKTAHFKKHKKLLEKYIANTAHLERSVNLILYLLGSTSNHKSLCHCNVFSFYGQVTKEEAPYKQANR